ncbi:MAG: ATP-binding cassette domain-containing protein [Actinobacteria bacterium]|nr:ATP-binding cassette domain-containing protein [Actinomycetota bacterium]
MKSDELRLLLSRSRRFVSIIAIAAIIWSAIIIVNAYLIAEIIIRIINHRPAVPMLIFALGSLWLFRAIFQSGFDYFCSTEAIRMKRELRNETTQQVGNFSNLSASELSNVLIKGLNSLDVYIGKFIPQLLFAVITPLAVLATIFSQDFIAGSIALVTLPLIPVFGSLIGRYSADAVNRKWRTLGTLSKYFEDSMRGFATLKIFGRTKSQGKRIEEMGNRYTYETMKVLRISFLSAFALELVATISVAVVAVSVGLRLVSGSIDFHTALLVLILAPEVYFPVRNAASLFHASQDGTEALKNLNEIESEIIPLSISASVAIQDIQSISWGDWRFPRSQSEEIIIPASQVMRGEMLFLLGESGVGKSTFALNLLGLSFNAPIRVRTMDQTLTLSPSLQKEWQKLLGWIPQNPQLASGTVRDQFTLLGAHLSDSAIERALNDAGLQVSDLPQGLDSRIGKGGEGSHSASGGQVRRIAVARAMIRNPVLIIADEPTADLDDVSAKAVMDLLRSAQRNGAMVICITHDLSLATSGDRISEVKRSRI